MLALLVDLALVQASPRANATALVLLGSAAIAALSSLEEFSQFWVPVRSPDAFDLLASLTGILAATATALLLAPYVTVPQPAPADTA
jgi:hypothetical protein